MNEEKQRTSKQNRAIHKFFSLLADELNMAGLDQRVILKPSFSIWWTPEAIKENLWKPLQEAMYQKDHTADLTTSQIDKVFEQLARIIGEKHGLELKFPSIEESESYLQSLEDIK